MIAEAVSAAGEQTATQHFEAFPFTPTPQRADVLSAVVRGVSQFETLFTDFERACVPLCANPHTCFKCRNRLGLVSARLCDPRARVWEVWKKGPEPDVVGILYLTDVIPGGDAKAHYVFWDTGLRDKTELIEQMIDWCFADHDGWLALKRLTVEVPDYAFALARHAANKLGFGGQFKYFIPNRGKQFIPVEGIKRNVLPWRGEMHDMLILGRLNG